LLRVRIIHIRLQSGDITEPGAVATGSQAQGGLPFRLLLAARSVVNARWTQEMQIDSIIRSLPLPVLYLGARSQLQLKHFIRTAHVYF
jgi:hypothetical protein